MLVFVFGTAAVLAAALFAARKCKFKNRELILDVLAVVMPLSEIWKQLLLTSSGGGYQWWYFPFQLCSMPLYLLPLRQILLRVHGSGAPVNVITDFLADFSLLGGIFAFADQSGMHYKLAVLTVHSYLWHFTMIFLGLYLVLSGRHGAADRDNRGNAADPGETKLQKLSFLAKAAKSYAPCAALFLMLAAAAEVFNALFHGFGEINMFYISPWEPVTQIILRDIAVYIGTIPEIILYLILILCGGFVIHLIAGLFVSLLYCSKD